jgi:hypothetical protein
MSKNLKDRQKSFKDVTIDGTKQMKLWKDLLRQMELKRKICMVCKKKQKLLLLILNKKTFF